MMPDKLTDAELAEGLRMLREPLYRGGVWFCLHGETALRELAALRAFREAIQDAALAYDDPRRAGKPPTADHGLELFGAVEEALSGAQAAAGPPDREVLVEQVAKLLADRQTLRQRLASVCGALADAGDVVFSPENPGAAVRELVERRNAERAARERLVAEFRRRCDERKPGPVPLGYPSSAAAAWHDAAVLLAALDKPEGA